MHSRLGGRVGRASAPAADAWVRECGLSVFRTSSKLINYATKITIDCDYNSRKMKKYGVAIMPALPFFEERCVRLFKALRRCSVRKRRSSFLAAHRWAEKTKIFVLRAQWVNHLRPYMHEQRVRSCPILASSLCTTYACKIRAFL